MPGSLCDGFPVSPASPVVTSGSSQIWGWTQFAWLDSYQMMVIDHGIFQCCLLVDIIGGNLNIPPVRIGFTIVCYTYLHLIIFPTAHVSAFFGKCAFLVQEATLPDHKRFCNSSANLKKAFLNRCDFTLPKGGHFTELWKSFFWIGISLLSGSFSYVKNQDGRILLFPPLPIIDSWLSPHCWTAVATSKLLSHLFLQRGRLLAPCHAHRAKGLPRTPET